MPSFWKRTQAYLSNHSNLFFFTGGIIGGTFLLSQYAIAKFHQIQENLTNDRTAKEKRNQEDCIFTVLALLPTVGEQLSARLNVEQLTESLRAQALPPQSAQSHSQESSHPPLSSVDQPQLAGQPQQGSDQPLPAKSEADVSFEASTASCPPQPQHDALQQTPIQPACDPVLLERQAKLKLWNELKVVSFSRTLTSLYCAALLTLQAHVQLNLIGRFAYLASIEAQTKPASADNVCGQLSQTLDQSGLHDKSGLVALDHETERLYLTYSWWFLHRGWDHMATRVVRAIEATLSGLPVKAQITMDEMRALISNARSSIEHELAQGSAKQSNFLEVLFPVNQEQELETLVQSGAVSAEEAHETLRANQHLRLLLDETRDMIESADFSSVLKLCLDRVFDVFFNTMSPAFGVQPLSESVAASPFGMDAFTGARIHEINEEAQKGRAVRLASLFPAVARQSQLAIHGVPNEYIEALADSKELRAFSAVIYSAWPQEPQ